MFKEELKFIKILAAGFFVGLGLVLFGSPASAITPLSFSNNTFPDDYVLTAEASPYLVQTTIIKVGAGTTVTIEPGVVIKMKTGLAFPVEFTVDGTLIANGTAEAPVVFTSDKDDTYGGDSNGDETATSPGRGNWNRMSLSQATSRLELYHTILRYGGKFTGAMIELHPGPTAIIEDSVIEQSLGAGIALNSTATITNLTLTRSTVRNNALHGVGVSNKSLVNITGSAFYGNERGVAIDLNADAAHLTISNNSFYSNTNGGLTYDDTELLSVINNWWGLSSGPQHSSNPSGTGERAVGNITLSPWTSQDPANQAPTLSYAGTDGYTTDGVEPNISFKTQSAPVFRVLYSDPEGVAANYMRLIVGSTTYAMATGTSGVYEFSAATSTFAKASYSYHFEASDGTNTARLPASGELSFEVRNTPVLLVPGIMGTEMWKNADLIWPDISEILRNPSDDFMNVLSMNSDGTFADNQITLGDIVRNPPTKDIFTGLITEFLGNGYQEATDLFVLPYDWRLDINTTSDSLKDKINNIKTQTGSNKIDIIAHSMGGLLSKQYILNNGSNSINKLIFVGTPHLGAPKAAKTLLLGDDLGISLVVPLLDFQRVKYIAQNMPAIYQLLPSYEYFLQIGNYYSELDGVNYDYDRMRQYLFDSGLNLILINDANNFHSTAMDNFDATGIDTYNITGCTTPTISSITKRSDMNNEYTMQMSAGDGTVPFGSSKAVSITAGKSYYFKNHGFLSSLFPRIDHAELPSASGIKELITNIITGSNISLPSYATQNSSECKLEGEMVSTHSPVNLHIYDSSGNHVGRGENDGIEYEISGVAYEEIGENKFVFLPTSAGQSYRVVLDGTGSGTFSLRVSKVENNEITETAYYSNLPVNTSTEATVTLAADVSNTVLSVDQNGTGNFAAAPVSAVLDAAQSADITKPSSAITFFGGLISATVSLSSTDDNAGILKIEYSLDNGSTWRTYSSSFIINTVGVNSIQYRATDRAGNIESIKSKTIEITIPNAVVPFMTNVVTPKENPVAESTPQVLGEQAERPANEQYTKEAILDALAGADKDTLLDYLGKTRDTALEVKVAQDYGKYLVLDKAAINFITYGTKSTGKLGIGERAGVLRSYQYAFGKLPQTAVDWQDVVNIATGQLPSRRNVEKEQEARNIVKKIYGNIDEQSVIKIAYGLRPETRDIKKERLGLRRFGEIFRRMPSSVLDWNIFRKLVY